MFCARPQTVSGYPWSVRGLVSCPCPVRVSVYCRSVRVLSVYPCPVGVSESRSGVTYTYQHKCIEFTTGMQYEG